MSDRSPRTHIYIIDGTFSRLVTGHETNAGMTYRLLEEVGQTVTQSVSYHPGVQGQGWTKWLAAAAGIGINEAMAEGYATLASRYRPGDRIVLMGYSRGAYAVRSLAGWIGQVGLLKAQHAMQRRVQRSFRYYEAMRPSRQAKRFSERYCHRDIHIEMVGVWDTVSALGLPYPLINRLVPMATDFHDDRIGDGVRHAYHALAIDETRAAYDPIMWQPRPEWPGHMQQMWFAGNHGDVGGHVWRSAAARPLANISLVWMLEHLERCDVTLPDGWRERFPQDRWPRLVAIGAGLPSCFCSEFAAWFSPVRRNKCIPVLAIASVVCAVIGHGRRSQPRICRTQSRNRLAVCALCQTPIRRFTYD